MTRGRWVAGEAVGRAGLAAVVCAVLGAGGTAAAAPPRDEDPSRAIVKLYVTSVGRDVTSPWRPGWSVSGTGSGAVVAGGRVLTAAHVVDDQTFVMVRLNGTARKVRARVLFVSHVADLALLAVDDPSFLDGVAPLELGELPEVQAEVAAFGFPNGGETLSITEGVVARVEDGVYVHSWERLLEVQMDAAIAPGSSGGPLLEDGRIVGVAMQGFKESAIGCAVPVTLVRQFLADVEDGRVDGVPELGIAWQKLENPALRASLRVPPGEGGVVVTRVDLVPAAGVLEKGDVLLSIAGQDVADDGTVELRDGERTGLSHATDLLQLGATVAVTFLRDGAVRRGEVRLTRPRGDGHLVPRLFERNTDYFVFGGLAFATLTRNMLDVAREWAPPRLAALAGRPQRRPGEEVVLLADVLVGEVNSGYEDLRWQTVAEVDGAEVVSLAELVRRVERPDGGPFVVFGLGDGSRVTVDRQRAVATSAEVLGRYEVPADRSPRLRALAATTQAASLVPPAAGAP